MEEETYFLGSAEVEELLDRFSTDQFDDLLIQIIKKMKERKENEEEEEKENENG